MVVDTDERFPELDALLDTHRRRDPRSEHNVYLDAPALAERLFGDHMTANMSLLGAAYQARRAAGLRRGASSRRSSSTASRSR